MQKIWADTAPYGVSGIQGSVELATRSEISAIGHWRHSFSNQRKDHRYYELVEDTLRQGFEHRYLILKDAQGRVGAAQPIFLLDQDMLAATPSAVSDLPPLKWSSLKYDFRMEDEIDGKEEAYG